MLNRKGGTRAAMVSLLAVSFGGSLLMPLTAQAHDLPADHFNRFDQERFSDQSRFDRFDDRFAQIAAQRAHERRERQEKRERELRRERERWHDHGNRRF